MDNEVEELSIDKDKIIQILLKHLMNVQNEFVYLKNKTGLNASDKSTSEKKDGGKYLFDAISGSGDGGNLSSEPTAPSRDGGNLSTKPTGTSRDGGNHSTKPTGNSHDGGNHSTKPTGTSHDGGNHSTKPTETSRDGGNLSEKPITTSSNGGNLSENPNEISPDSNNQQDWLYPVFEKGLIKALEQYMNNGDRQNSLYGFYADFVDAVSDKNKATAERKEAAKNVNLEDTHVLPANIKENSDSTGILGTALLKNMAYNAPWDLAEKIACELILLHNSGKATSPQLRKVSYLSEDGNAKHLPKLQRAGLIQKVPPKSYALTEKSKRLLLELFGVPKTK